MLEEPKRKRRRDKRKPTRIELYIHYLLLRLIVLILCALPAQWVLSFAAWLGRVLWRFYKRGRIRAINNLHAAYPDKDMQWYEKMSRRSLEHVVMLAAELIITPKQAKKENWRDYSRYINCETVKWRMKAGEPMLMVTGHYGNFEIVGYLMSLFGFNVYSIARPLDNPYMNDYLYGIREKHGQKIINKKGASAEMGKVLENGGTLCFIADQDAGKKGIFVNFFGRPASSYRSIGLTAIYYNVPIVVGVGRRVDNKFFFEIEISRVIEPDEWQGKDDPLLWLTQEYTSALEQVIRKDPSQYWWMHRRWKTQPRDKKKKSQKQADTAAITQNGEK